MQSLGSHDDWPRVDLVVIDGGEGQVNRVREVLSEMEIKVPIIGIPQFNGFIVAGAYKSFSIGAKSKGYNCFCMIRQHVL